MPITAPVRPDSMGIRAPAATGSATTHPTSSARHPDRHACAAPQKRPRICKFPTTTLPEFCNDKQTPTSHRRLDETAMLAVATYASHNVHWEETACAMDSPATITPPPPFPEVAESAKDDDDSDEMDDDPPSSEPDLQREHRDADSSYGDDTGSIMNYGSVADSIYNFRVENGRTYHSYAEGKYYVPNDEPEQKRMDLTYFSIYRMFEGKAFFAPVSNPQRILDVGTGTGIWAFDVADQYPSAQVVGIDLSPIQPSWVPPNVEFRIDDIDKPWVYQQPIDLVHSRVCSGIAIRNWPNYLAEAYRCLKPGGWVEAQEFMLEAMSDDDSFPPDSAILEWHEAANRGAALGGCHMRVSSQQIKSYMEEAGFVNVQTIDMKWPMSPWSEDPRLREAGLYVKLGVVREYGGDLLGMSLAVFTRYLGWDIEDLEQLLARVEREWQRDDIHGYWPLFVVYGQKPTDA